MSTTYEAVIGLEIHAQISTKTKLFCGCDNDSFNKEPNTNVCPVCMGFPGMLPVPNEVAIQKGARAALALKCTLKPFSKFDRKNYFYPDLPNGFQISQYDEPISEKGELQIENEGEKKVIRITRIHLENDAGKLTHVAKGSLVDFNRSGTPLMEIVTEPDLRSAKEASALARAIQTILRYVGASEADMEKGMMRFDASVSTRPKGEEKLYPRAEIKNLNSFKSLESAINYEIARQTKLWQKGEPMDGSITVGWMDDEQKTKLLRDKEDAADYRYFPEPDIPPIHLTQEQIEQWKKELPELPSARRKKFIEQYGTTEEEATFFTENAALANYFEQVADQSGDPKKAASFIGTTLIARLKEEGIDIQNCPISPGNLAALIQHVNKGSISNNTAKTTVFEAMFTTGKSADKIIAEQGLEQVSDSSAIEELVEKVIQENPKVVEDFKSGTQNALGFLVGQVMKASKGQANPQMVNDVLRKKLQ